MNGTGRRMRRGVRHDGALGLLVLCMAALPPAAQAGGRLLATGGVTEVEGSAGGGIVPWALIGGYGTKDEIGTSAFYTQLELDDFRLRAAGLAFGIHDRIELSYARQKFGLGSTVSGHSIEQDVFGAKLRVAGDAVYDQDSPLPQIAIGAQYKKNRDFAFIPRALGAKKDSGVDFYLAATKLYLAGLAGRNVLVSGTLRATRANQLGLLGFGGDLNDRYRIQFEGSAAIFLNDNIAIGVEYRAKPNNLSAYREDDYQDVFLAWVPNKHIAVTGAWAYLGQIADKRRQGGVYLSLQTGF